MLVHPSTMQMRKLSIVQHEADSIRYAYVIGEIDVESEYITIKCYFSINKRKIRHLVLLGHYTL